MVGPTHPTALASLYPLLLRFSKPVPNVTASSLSLTNGRVTWYATPPSPLPLHRLALTPCPPFLPPSASLLQTVV